MRLRENKRLSVNLLCVVVFRWIQVGSAGVAVFSLLFFLTTPCRVHRTGMPTQTPLSEIWLHHIQQIWVAREGGKRERDTPWGPLISLLWPAPWLILCFLTQIVMPYLGEGRERKKRACDWRVWCGHWKEFSKFLPLPLKNEAGSGGRVDKNPREHCS